MCADNANQPLPRPVVATQLYDENDEQDQIQEETGLRINGSSCNQDTGDSSFTKTMLFGPYNP